MKRKIKNIIMIVFICIMCTSMFFTMNYAKNHIATSMNSGAPQMQGENGAPPDMPNENSQNTSDETTNANNNSNSTDTNKPTNDNMGEPPEKTDGEDNNAPSGGMPNDNNNSSLSYGYYIAFGTEAFISSILLVYLVMSSFNKKTFKETFKSSKKIIASILIIIILTSGLTYTDSIIATKFFLSSDTVTQGKPDNFGGNDSSPITYSSSNEIKSDDTITSGSYESTTADENALLIDSDNTVNMSNITVNKTGDSDGGDNTSFYGINSAILAKDGANLTLKNITVTTDATGANGVFCYGGSATTNNSSSDETTVTISDSKITTSKDNSGGIMTTGGGIMNAYNLTINTSGTSSAAIRTDRGGGTVTVDGGTYTTTGQGSPTVYSTANINVSNATLVAKASEGIVIEGKNSVSLDNVNLTDTNNKLNGQSTTYKNIFLYQSMSGDAADGVSEFTAKDSKITTNNGDSFYITNTTATINLTNNSIVNNDSDENFLRAQKDSWGNSGSNGGIVSLNMTNQTATGNIVIDSISTLDMTMKTNSYYEGTINGDNTAKSITLTLDKTSKIKLTGDSYITTLNNSDSSNSNIDFNGYTLYVNGKAIN
ncbi:hypothetical protein [Clostridium sp. MSJ-8]|uniref:hypothetical protein n=1 Tax=Clostridium sp. MSJ-8 TaxID=2841510 RepID=UPI0020A1A90C|nr:hypothetical protein [Clostridium sp. MSJ-8]